MTSVEVNYPAPNGEAGSYVNFSGGLAGIAITQHGSDWYWAVTAVMMASTFAFVGFSITKPREHRLFHYITAAITMVASMAYFSMASNIGWTPTAVEFVRSDPVVAGLNRQVFYVRYIDWVITTPLLLMDLLLTAGLPWPTVLFTILIDEIMIVAGLAGALVRSTYKFGYFTFGMFALFYIGYVLIFEARRNAYRLGGDIGRVFLLCGSWTFFLWLLYPISWGLCEGGNVIAPDSEAVFYGVLDIMAKPVFGTLLLFGHRNIDPSRLGMHIEDYHNDPVASDSSKDYEKGSSQKQSANGSRLEGPGDNNQGGRVLSTNAIASHPTQTGGQNDTYITALPPAAVQRNVSNQSGSNRGSVQQRERSQGAVAPGGQQAYEQRRQQTSQQVQQQSQPQGQSQRTASARSSGRNSGRASPGLVGGAAARRQVGQGVNSGHSSQYNSGRASTERRPADFQARDGQMYATDTSGRRTFPAQGQQQVESSNAGFGIHDDGMHETSMRQSRDSGGGGFMASVRNALSGGSGQANSSTGVGSSTANYRNTTGTNQFSNTHGDAGAYQGTGADTRDADVYESTASNRDGAMSGAYIGNTGGEERDIMNARTQYISGGREGQDYTTSASNEAGAYRNETTSPSGRFDHISEEGDSTGAGTGGAHFGAVGGNSYDRPLSSSNLGFGIHDNGQMETTGVQQMDTSEQNMTMAGSGERGAGVSSTTGQEQGINRDDMLQSQSSTQATSIPQEFFSRAPAGATPTIRHETNADGTVTYYTTYSYTAASSK